MFFLIIMIPAAIMSYCFGDAGAIIAAIALHCELTKL